MKKAKLTKRFLDKLSKQLKSKIISYKRFKSGRANPVFLLRLGNKDECVLKLYSEKNPSKYSNDISVFKLFSTNKLIPNILFKGNWNKWKYIIITKIKGKNIEEINIKIIPKKELSKIFFDIGKLVAQLHSHTISKFGRINNSQFKSWRSFLQNLNKKYLAQLRYSEFDYLIDDIKTYLDKNIHLIKGVKKGSFIHDDIQPQNILVENNKLAGIIDFDRAFFGDPMYELPYCENSFYHVLGKNLQIFMIKNFYKGYLSVRKLDKKRYKRVKNYYYMCKYLRHMTGFKSLKKVLSKKVCKEMKIYFISEVENILI